MSSTLINDNHMTNSTALKNRPKIWAIASGKGGVGKSFVTTSLGMALAEQGKKTVLVDLDLGSANMHTCLGVNSPKTTLSHLFTQENVDINDLIVYHTNTKLGLISGASDSLEIANLKHFQKMKVMRNLAHIDADFVILDLGAGTSFNTLDFFIHADHALLTVIPEPTSVENSYRFIKCMLARKLKDLPQKTKDIMNNVLIQHRSREGKPQSFSTFLEDMRLQFPDHELKIRSELENLNLNLIVNQVFGDSDAKLGHSMAIMFQRYFDIDLNILGYLFHDTRVIHALRQKRVYYHSFPQSKNVMNINSIATHLITRQTIYK